MEKNKGMSTSSNCSSDGLAGSGTEGDRVDAVPSPTTTTTTNAAGRGHEGSPTGMPVNQPVTTSTLLRGCSRVNRFADYFVICGLDLDTGLEPDRFSGESDDFGTTCVHGEDTVLLILASLPLIEAEQSKCCRRGRFNVKNTFRTDKTIV